MGEKVNALAQRESPAIKRARHEKKFSIRILFWLIISVLLSISIISILSSCEQRSEKGAADRTAPMDAATPSASTSENQAAVSRLDKILAKGELIVAMSPDFAPMEFIDSRKSGQDKYVGTDPWFAKYIADELGVELRIAAMNFNSLEDAVISGEADLIVSGFAATEKRAEVLELSDYYNIISDDGSRLVVLKDSADEYQDADDFNGKTIAVQTPSIQYNLLIEQIPGAKPELITHINDGVKMLLTNKAEAFAIDGANGRAICDNYPDLTMSGFKFEYPVEGNVICMRKGETALLSRINEIIAKATAGDMFGKWLNDAKDLVAEIGWQD